MASSDDCYMLRVLTWNAWFNEDVELELRMGGIVRIVTSNVPDVLALQEVTPRMLSLLRAPLQSAGYAVLEPKLNSPYFVVLCVSDRLRLKSSDFHAFASSVMGRGVFMISAVLGDLELEVGTCHLESHVAALHGATPVQTVSAATARRAQLPEALAALERRRGSGAAAICLGDFSWCSARDGCAAGETAGEHWNDAWVATNAAAGYTYDARASPMLRGGSSYQARSDRVLYTGARLTVRSARLVGTAPLPGLERSATDPRSVLPSDHYGVLVEFALKRQRADAPEAAASSGGACAEAAPSSFFAPRRRRAPGPLGAEASTVNGHQLSGGWKCYNAALLAKEWGDFEALARRLGERGPLKIAAFDFDQCLAATNFGGGPLDWTHRFECCRRKIRLLQVHQIYSFVCFYSFVCSSILLLLQERGFAVVVITNEANITRFKKPLKVQEACERKIGRLEGWAADVCASGAGPQEAPRAVLLLCCCAGRTAAPGAYRKPSSGSWLWLEAWAALRGLSVDRSQSFYVGDAAGRPRDHGDCDLMFAKGLGLRYATESAFFTVRGGDWGVTEG
jgi:DNA 3'-phosphatase